MSCAETCKGLEYYGVMLLGVINTLSAGGEEEKMAIRYGSYSKTIIVAAIVAVIMGIFAGCEPAYTPTSKEHATVYTAPSAEIEELSEQIKQLVKGLEYSDKVAEDFVKMVSGWKDEQGRPVLIAWKKRLAKAKEDCEQGKISKDQLAKVEENIVREVSHRVKKELSFNDKFFDLPDVIKHKQARCLGYSQLLNVLGNSIEISVKAIQVLEEMTGAFSKGHGACLVSLVDRKTMMVDLVPGGFVSKPFIIKKEFTKVGNYWELKDKDNPLGIHRRIQIFDRNGLTAAIYNDRGTMYYDMGQLSKATSNYTKAVELNPKYAEAYTSRGVAYNKLGQHTQAISDHTKAIELNPKYAMAYTNRGSAYDALGQHIQAISDYTIAIELDPKVSEAYYNRGNAYDDLGQYTKAISDFNKAIELNPKYAEAYVNRGATYIHLGQYTKAISDCTVAIKLNPKFTEAYVNRGTAYGKLDKTSEAISDYTKASELNPKYADAYYNRGTTYADMGQDTRAISDYTKAIELNPKHAVAYYNRARAYRRLGQHIQAIANYTKAIELNPKDVAAYNNRGVIYVDLGEYTKAISDYTRVIELNPKNAVAYNNRGVAYAHLRKFEEAKKDLLTAVKLDPALKPLVKSISDIFKLNLKLD